MIKPTSKVSNSSSCTIIASLQAGNSGAIEELYALHREDFFRWASYRFEGTRQDFEDAWQDAIIAFYQQVNQGKLVHLRHEVRTWLYAVGYKRLLNNNRKMNRILWKDQIDDALLTIDLEQESIDPEKVKFLEAALKSMSSQCREILVARYYHNLGIEEIQQNWNLKNANTTSATLARCLGRLKDCFKKTYTIFYNG